MNETNKQTNVGVEMENLPKRLASRDWGTLTYARSSLNQLVKVRRSQI